MSIETKRAAVHNNVAAHAAVLKQSITFLAGLERTREADPMVTKARLKTARERVTTDQKNLQTAVEAAEQLEEADPLTGAA